jgi:ATP-dependent RNA helicase HelY
MPARTVVIGRMSKWDGRRRRVLIPNEFQQMAGRAGRRGMDAYGHVVVPYSPFIPFREAMEVATGDLHPVQSAFAIRYNTVLNLWDPPRGERVRQMLQRSLAQYQTSQRIRVMEHDVLEIEAELIGLTAGRAEEIAREDELFEEYASISRSMQARQVEERDLKREIATVRTEIETATPWTEPGRLALRKLLRSIPAGLVVHTRDHGWCIFLGRGGQGGVGLFLSADDQQVHLLHEYRVIDYVQEESRITLPDELVEPPDVIRNPLDIIDEETLGAIMSDLAELDLPDLDELARAHRELIRQQTDAEVARIEAELKEIRDQLNQLRERKETHPYNDPKKRKQHQRSLRERDALEKEKNTLEEILDREIDAEDVRIRGIIRGIRDILHRFGYLRRGYPTEKADMLADIFDNDGLIICELVDRGILDALLPEELAELFSWFSFDREFRYTNGFSLPNRLIAVRKRLEELEHDIIGEERDLKLFISEGHNPSFYGPALHWCRGWSMAQIGEEIELSEGDLVITFNKTIDLMRQVREMLADVMPDHPLREKLRAAEKMVRRGIVEQSLSLGFTPIADLPDDEEPDDPAGEDIDTPDDEAAALD